MSLQQQLDTLLSTHRGMIPSENLYNQALSIVTTKLGPNAWLDLKYTPHGVRAYYGVIHD